MVFYQVEREFRKPKSRLADWGIMFSDVIKSSWKREAEAWERPGFGGPRSKDKGLQAYPLLGGRGDKREVFGGGFSGRRTTVRLGELRLAPWSRQYMRGGDDWGPAAREQQQGPPGRPGQLVLVGGKGWWRVWGDV